LLKRKTKTFVIVGDAKGTHYKNSPCILPGEEYISSGRKSFELAIDNIRETLEELKFMVMI
jgi:hypothetical protein